MTHTCPPPLQAMLSWALRELAEVQTRAAPPDPATGWEAFASDRLEWDPQAAVEVDHLYVRYARWCTAHGELVLAEDQVLAWLTQRAAPVRTGAVSAITIVVGVRVVA
jgi:hypothetical protein